MAKINWTAEAELWLKDIYDFIGIIPKLPQESFAVYTLVTSLFPYIRLEQVCNLLHNVFL
jgi:hypothetical protein